jgi:hypothetical protein
MTATSEFFNWYFGGVGGMGGWVLFMALAIIAIAYIIADSQWRNVKGAYAWLLGAILPALLLFPTLLYRYSASEVQESLGNLKETFFYIGLMGGIIPFVVAMGYAIANFGAQPTTAEQPPPGTGAKEPGPSIGGAVSLPPKPSPSRPQSQRPLVNAWLVNEDTGQNHQLYEGDTRIGRGSNNDLCFPDRSVSREHVLIREDKGHFFIRDIGSRSGTYVNQKRIDETYKLAHGDLVEIGDLRLRFVTARP